MHWLSRALCCLLLSATNLSVLADEASTSLPDQHFTLAPVEIQLSHELKTAAEHYSNGEWLPAVEQLTALLEAAPGQANNADFHFLLGESLVQLQRFEEASSAFRKLLKLMPTESQAARAEFRLAEAAMLQGRDKVAARLLEQYHTRYPEHELNAHALPYLAHLVAGENSTRALSLFSLALQKYPDGPLARECSFQIALLHYEAGKYLDAKTRLLSLVETGNRTKKTGYWHALYWLAMSEFHLGQYEDALDRFAGELSDSNPKHSFQAASVYFAAESLRKLGRPAEAEQAYQLLRQNCPQSEYYAPSLIGELKCLRESQDADRALDLYQQWRQRKDDPAEGDGLRLVAEVLLSAGRFVEAHQLLRPLVESPSPLNHPHARAQHYQSLYLYALTLQGLGNANQASEVLGRVRIDLASADLAERVILARVELSNETGDFDAAIRTGLDAEARFPNGRLLDAVRAQLVRAFIQANRLNEAKAKFLEMQQSGTAREELVRAARWLGEATYAANDLVNARRVFEVLNRWPQHDSDRAQAISGLAWIDVKEDHHASAITRFEQFLQLFPGHASIPDVRLALSQSLSELGNSQQAVEVLTFFEQLDQDHPARAQGLYRLALLLEANPREQERAEQIAQLLVEDHPTYERRDAALYLLGTLRRKAGSPAAVESFAEIVNQHYTSKYWADSLYRLAQEAAAGDDPQTAKQYLTKLISSDRDHRVLPHALYLKGKLESDSRSWPAARATLRQLIRDYPDSELADVARYGVAESYFQEKNFAHAQQLFELLSREGRLPAGSAWQAMLQLRRAQLLIQRQQYMEALSIAKDMAKDFPSFSLQHEVAYVLGRARAARGEFSDARRHYQSVVETDPDYQREISAMAQWMIGETHFHQKNFHQAIQSYQPVYTETTFATWQAASLLQVGKCHEKLEDVERAKRAYARVVEEFGESRWAREAAERLRVLKRNK